MRRFCLLAVLAAGSTVLHAQCSNAPCIDSLQSDFAGTDFAPAHGAAITAGTPVGSAPFFWLFINGSFLGEASTTVTWTGVGAPGGTSLFVESYGTSQMIVDVPTNLFASPGTATITVTQDPGNGARTSNASTFTVNRPLAASALPVGVVYISYSQPLATGGTGPYNLQYLS